MLFSVYSLNPTIKPEVCKIQQSLRKHDNKQSWRRTTQKHLCSDSSPAHRNSSSLTLTLKQCLILNSQTAFGSAESTELQHITVTDHKTVFGNTVWSRWKYKNMAETSLASCLFPTLFFYEVLISVHLIYAVILCLMLVVFCLFASFPAVLILVYKLHI